MKTKINYKTTVASGVSDGYALVDVEHGGDKILSVLKSVARKIRLTLLTYNVSSWSNRGELTVQATYGTPKGVPKKSITLFI